MTVHALAGLPRSGSTLLCNILNQHPDVHASSTSPLFGCVAAVADTLTASPEAKAGLANIPGAYENYLVAVRNLVAGFYEHRPEAVVIDKGRGWATRPALLGQIDPEARMIVCVRDPRDVVASIIRRDRETALFAAEFGLAIQDQVTNLTSIEGIVGGPIHFVESMLRTNTPAAWVAFERLAANPDLVLERLSDALGLDAHKWDFKNVENTSTDLDALYNGKFPHVGAGEVTPPKVPWTETLPADAGAYILSLCPTLAQTFGYE